MVYGRYSLGGSGELEGELRADFEAMDLPGIEKVEIANNEFGLKYRLLRDEP